MRGVNLASFNRKIYYIVQQYINMDQNETEALEENAHNELSTDEFYEKIGNKLEQALSE